MTYGMLASQNCFLTNIVNQLHEISKKVNSVERLTRHLNKGIPKDAQKSYLTFVSTMVSSNPIIHIDDSDVIKPEGRKLDALKQDYVIRLKSNRKLFYHNKWVMATELRNRRKGKVRMPLYYKGRSHDAYLSHVKVQITAYKEFILLKF